MLVAAARVGVGSQIGRSTTCFTSIQTGRKDTTGREQPGRTRDAKNTQQAAAYSAAKRHEYLTQSPRYRATNKGRAMRWPSTTVIPTGKISDDTNKAPNTSWLLLRPSVRTRIRPRQSSPTASRPRMMVECRRPSETSPQRRARQRCATSNTQPCQDHQDKRQRPSWIEDHGLYTTVDSGMELPKSRNP